MSNIILTTDCPRKCRYCFAKDNSDNPMHFTMENFKKAIDWLEADTDLVYRIALLGGEPTAHPEFLNFLEYLLKKRIKTIVFTNGMVDDIRFYSAIINMAQENEVKSKEDLGFCVNVNEEKYRSNKELFFQNIFFSNLGRVSNLSFNIFEIDFDPSFLVDMIKHYKLIPNIRLGLAAPLGNSNEYLKAEFYPAVAEKVLVLARKALEDNISIGFDCGWVKCMFTKENHKEMESLKISPLVYDCGTVMDIYPNLEVANCYPLSRVMRAKIDDFDSYGQLHSFWSKEVKTYTPIYDDCYSCKYFEKECAGGCRAHKANG